MTVVLGGGAGHVRRLLHAQRRCRQGDGNLAAVRTALEVQPRQSKGALSADSQGPAGDSACNALVLLHGTAWAHIWRSHSNPKPGRGTGQGATHRDRPARGAASGDDRAGSAAFAGRGGVAVRQSALHA